jgi:GH15 family glucan-1,4-alpha-glucosidase
MKQLAGIARKVSAQANMAYKPIENYAMIGDMHTVALVSIDGAIDWLCLPHFDSPSVFGAILDDEKGGSFRIAPVDGNVTYKQFYWPDTNVLVTRFLAEHGAAELADFMPINREADGVHKHQLIRRLTVVRGTIEFELDCSPSFNYARDKHKAEPINGGAMFYSDSMNLALTTSIPIHISDGTAKARFKLEEGQTLVFNFRDVPPGSEWSLYMSDQEAERHFRDTVSYWRNWLSKCTYSGRWREMVHRSALALKLLTFEPTGAIVAAPTTSLPENIGGTRNWDYRYTWIRDSAFTIYAFMRIGLTEEAGKFMQFLSNICTSTPDGGPPLQIMYGIDGSRKIKEESLDHLKGYRDSKPVRVGNAAYQQLQLDIYGELLDAIYLYNKYGAPISYDEWLSVRKFVDWVCDNWQLEDEGIWEVRGKKQHFVYSKLMCWVALDRGLRLAENRSFPADRKRWLVERDRIFEDIIDKGWNDELQSFVQSYGSSTLDASNLMMPLVFFLSPTDPKVLSTIKATMKPFNKGGLLANSLVYRYNTTDTDDGLGSDEGTFNICSFWLVEALTRAGQFEPKYLNEARLIFERMSGFANHVGLYAEETGHSGEGLGNFPQAFTHLALISAAFNLDKALGSGI